MKLLLAADIFPPQSGGPATYSVFLANEFVKLGDEVIIVSLNSKSDKSLVNCNLYSVSYKNKLFKYLQYIFLLFKYSSNVDIIYAMGPVNAGLPALIVSFLRKKRLIVKVVGDYAWEQWQNQKSLVYREADKLKSSASNFVKPEDFTDVKVNLKINVLKLIEKKVVQKADKIIVPSEYLKKIVTNWGVNKEKISVIHNSFNLKPSSLISHGGETWLISVGRLVRWKGFDVLIYAVNDLIKEFPNLKMKIIGDGPEFNSLNKKIQNQKLENVVELLGNLNHEKTLSYINSADLFILNSGYEGLSHTILEALCFNIPVFASNIGGNPELIQNSVNGYLFEYNNYQEIKKLITNFLKNPKLKFFNHNNSLSKFSSQKMIKTTYELLQSLCPK